VQRHRRTRRTSAAAAAGVVARHVGRTTQKNKQAAQIHTKKQVSHAVTSRAAQILE